MKYATALLLAGTALTTAQQSSSPSEFSSPVEKACNPKSSPGHPDWNAPCNAVLAIEYQCIYGPDYLAEALAGGHSYNSRLMKKRQSSSNDGEAPPTQSNSTQRTCLCESQFFDQVTGCAACYKAHGDLSSDFESSLTDAEAISSLSSSYCAVSATPSLGLADFLFDWANSHTAAATATSSLKTMSDPLGNRTAVSLYYTPSVTGSAAWVVAEQTSGVSSGMGTFASENTVSGMIVATASANNAVAQTTGASGSSGSSSSSTSSGGAAVATAAGMGMLGLAGLVAML